MEREVYGQGVAAVSAAVQLSDQSGMVTRLEWCAAVVTLDVRWREDVHASAGCVSLVRDAMARSVSVADVGWLCPRHISELVPPAHAASVHFTSMAI